MDPQASAKPPHPAGVALPRGLKPEVALQLLLQSGHGALPGEPLSDVWLQALIDALVDLSSRDALTGLNNRRSFELALAREIDRVARSGEPAPGSCAGSFDSLPSSSSTIPSGSAAGRP